MTRSFMNAPADYASGGSFESSERGCVQSTSRSAFKLLRLVCDTAALRSDSQSLKFSVQVFRLALFQIQLHCLAAIADFDFTVAADVTDGGVGQFSIHPSDANLAAAARAQAVDFSFRPRR